MSPPGSRRLPAPASRRGGEVFREERAGRGATTARSTDGGQTFEQPIPVPGSTGSNYNSWDPAVAVGPDGTVYAVFMRTKNSQWYPVVAASFDHGQTFPRVTELVPPDAKNWGDRPFVAVGLDDSVYVTWDDGPNRTSSRISATRQAAAGSRPATSTSSCKSRPTTA
jgi:hypothetical protein